MFAVAAALAVPASASAWAWPVQGPVLRAFSFGSDPYAAGLHRGIDVGAPSGTGVVAPASGVVSFAGTVPSGGKTVSVLTPDGYSVTLLHLDSLSVERGATVAEGDVVGTVGSSGTPELTVPYVHLGVRWAADPEGYLDPLLFLPPVVRPPVPGEPPGPEPVPVPGASPAPPPASPVVVARPAGAPPVAPPRAAPARPRLSMPQRSPGRPSVPPVAARPRVVATVAATTREVERHPQRRATRPHAAPHVAPGPGKHASRVTPSTARAAVVAAQPERRPVPRTDRIPLIAPERPRSRHGLTPLVAALAAAMTVAVTAAAWWRRRARRQPQARSYHCRRCAST